MPDSTTTVAALREAMARFVAERDWEQFHSPKNLAMALAAEAAELMEHFLWIDNDASCALVRDPVQRGPIADEIADVAGVIFALCNALDLDLSDAVASKMARNVHKYPVEKCRGRYRVEEEDKETERQDKETRRQGDKEKERQADEAKPEQER